MTTTHDLTDRHQSGETVPDTDEHGLSSGDHGDDTIDDDTIDGTIKMAQT